MKRQLRILAVVVTGCLLPSAAAIAEDLSWGEQKLLETFSALEAGTMEAEEARDYCRRYLNAMPFAKVEPLRQIASGLFQVHDSFATETLCAALVESNLAGKVTVAHIRAVANSDNEEIFAYEFGRVMRVVYFAHHSKAPQ